MDPCALHYRRLVSRQPEKIADTTIFNIHFRLVNRQQVMNIKKT